MRKTAFLLAAAMLAAIFLGGCGYSKYSVTDLTVFDTVTVITGWERSRADFDETAGRILDALREYHRLYDIYNEYDGVNNLRTVNLAAGTAPVETDPRITELLTHARQVYDLTGGRVNAAMGSVLSLWHEARTETLVPPDPAALAEAARHTDFDSVVIDGSSVFLADPGMSLDVGALGKGFAVEAVCSALEAEGVTGYLVNVGGNVRAIGARGDGTPWRVAVSDPTGTETGLTLSLIGLAAVTSGTDQRYFEYGGATYHHIIDPETLMPSTRFAAVTVVSPDSGLADALSTALFNMSVEEGLALIDSLDGTEALWRLPDGSSAASAGFGGLL